MKYAKINTHDIANGTGVRVSLFVSGCRRHCPGCFNEEAQDFEYGQPFTYDTTMEILNYLDKPWIDGLTILGGEPLEPENAFVVLSLIKNVRSRYGNKKSIWLYTGYMYEEIMKADVSTAIGVLIMDKIDILVDGPFIEELKHPSLTFRGSSNQRIINMPETLKTGKVVLAEV